ncbi:MAG: hypothetical protein LLF76_00850 [Planctomycetaceae bacterium]|nr:hypothetical protein [Planctomycetaceae bacterium]
MKLERFKGNPIIRPNPANAWESAVTTNPGVIYDDAKRQFIMLYRAAGHDSEHVIRFGLAVSLDGFSFTRVSDHPVFAPSQDGFDAGCVEDPRIVRMGEHYYITYASRPFAPGQYWLAAGFRHNGCPQEFPLYLRGNRTTTGLTITRDFRTFIRAGAMTDVMHDDRDVILFPEKINGKYVMLHRPADWIGSAYGTEHPAIWISKADDLMGFKNSELLMTARFDWECKIGGSAPPIRTKHGWFVLYHAVGPDKHYRLGAVLLDLQDPGKVLHRAPDWLIQPEEDYELDGYYQGCIFPCGNVVVRDTLYVYYGGADKYIGVATCPFTALVEHLLSCPA